MEKDKSGSSALDPLKASASIRRLDPIIANKIAAGEVVERPSAVVKELVENAVDAGASQIAIEIKEAGKSLIRVSDNGSGIAIDDLLLAFERHATSKIAAVEDIYRIATLGFRGEALASIASVSRVECITKTQAAEAGVRVFVTGGFLSGFEAIGTNRGTTMIVRDLFYNTPVRYKFLKSNQAEQTAIVDLVNKLALSHPQISFTLTVDGRELYRTDGKGKLLHSLIAVFGRTMADHLVAIEAQAEDFSLSGFVSKPSYTRGNRNYQMLFVNGRYVKSEALQKTLYNCYKGLMTVGQFPAYALHLTLPFDGVDVNIHPSKTEVRFKDVVAVEGFVFSAVKNRLMSIDLVPKAAVPQGRPQIYANQSDTGRYWPAARVKETLEGNQDQGSAGAEDQAPVDLDALVGAFFEARTQVEAVQAVTATEQIALALEAFDRTTLYDDLAIVGQLFDTYIVAQRGTSAYLIDQHAAHERVLFEAFLHQFKTQTLESQMLLVPYIYTGDVVYHSEQTRALEWLMSLGITAEVFGERDWVVRAVPLVEGQPLNQAAITQLLDAFQHFKGETLQEAFVEDVIRKSCKAAIKANHRLTTAEITGLLKTLKHLENPYTCPHGRPIIIELTQGEIEKRFKRT